MGRIAFEPIVFPTNRVFKGDVMRCNMEQKGTVTYTPHHTHHTYVDGCVDSTPRLLLMIISKMKRHEKKRKRYCVTYTIYIILIRNPGVILIRFDSYSTLYIII